MTIKNSVCKYGRWKRHGFDGSVGADAQGQYGLPRYAGTRQTDTREPDGVERTGYGNRGGSARSRSERLEPVINLIPVESNG
jgi:hypothetical protein